MDKVEFVAKENGQKSSFTYIKRLDVKAITGREKHELLFGEDLQKIRVVLEGLGFEDVRNIKTA